MVAGADRAWHVAEQELLIQNGSDWSLLCLEQSSCEIPTLTAQGSLNSQLASQRHWGHLLPGLCRVFRVANSPGVSIAHGMSWGIAPLIPGRATASEAQTSSCHINFCPRVKVQDENREVEAA